jgi:hypothetical protein
LDRAVSDLVLLVVVPQQATFSVGRLTLTSDTVKVNDYLVLAGCLCMLTVLAAALRLIAAPASTAVINGQAVDGRRVRFALFFVAIAVSAFASIPLFADYLSAGYDLRYHLNRIEGIARGLAYLRANTSVK